ncbi:hypothetical protein LX87_02906 [Larkinella arboricola]|uniref:Uncharacterized protein n=1 Tax=Larkinella arboricola TaxID=643671 RepID=A0A327WXU5_LARAB|nr:hypothetical protein LX87_02906 [Larkinella arboricola]
MITLILRIILNGDYPYFGGFNDRFMNHIKSEIGVMLVQIIKLPILNKPLPT